MTSYFASITSLRGHALRALRFGVVSALGLALDFSLFLTLIRLGVSPFAANLASSAIALTFVYCASVRRVFRYEGRFIAALFIAYLVYHVCGTLLISLFISEVVHRGVAPALVKIGIIPATFGANYLFMHWLTTNRERWIARVG